METHRLALPPGYRIENYEIQAVLGKGGFGITYVAYDWSLKRHMAVKELLPDTIATRLEGSTVVAMSTAHEEGWQWARERFVDEARILAGFHHPNIIAVHRLIEANGTVYLVMDHLPGSSYEARLREIGTEPNQASLMRVIGPILDGLKEVHAAGLLHRDIKPENILFDGRGNPILIDFGAARASVGATMTMTSIVTHGYSPAEQYQTKGKMGPWTDIYAMAAVMCRAITGEKPPVAADRLMEDDFVWLSARRLPGFSPPFPKAVDNALQVRPEDRPQQISYWERHMGAIRTPKLSPKTPPDSLPKVELKSPQDHPSTKEHSRKAPKKAGLMIIAVISVLVLIGIAGLIAVAARPTPEQLFKQGLAYLTGNGVPKDEARAYEILLRLAQAGNVEAQAQIGWMHLFGGGTANDEVEAFKWTLKAAEQGDPSAQRLLGSMYANGRCVAKDEVEAVKWYRKSAEQGDQQAKENLLSLER